MKMDRIMEKSNNITKIIFQFNIISLAFEDSVMLFYAIFYLLQKILCPMNSLTYELYLTHQLTLFSLVLI